jgi:anaerobic glycerol-3-phosphate dehydrogenase
VKVILYSKSGCHLCEGLQEKLEQIQSIAFDLEIRDITTRDDWFQMYQYEIPVLFWATDASATENAAHPSASLHPIPRPSPRSSVQQLEQMLQKYLGSDRP